LEQFKLLPRKYVSRPPTPTDVMISAGIKGAFILVVSFTINYSYVNILSPLQGAGNQTAV